MAFFFFESTIKLNFSSKTSKDIPSAGLWYPTDCNFVFLKFLAIFDFIHEPVYSFGESQNFVGTFYKGGVALAIFFGDGS